MVTEEPTDQGINDSIAIEQGRQKDRGIVELRTLSTCLPSSQA